MNPPPPQSHFGEIGRVVIVGKKFSISYERCPEFIFIYLLIKKLNRVYPSIRLPPPPLISPVVIYILLKTINTPNDVICDNFCLSCYLQVNVNSTLPMLNLHLREHSEFNGCHKS